MKTTRSTLAALLGAALLALAAAPAVADETIVGPVNRIVLAADGASATATLKDGKSGLDVVITVTDELTLDKFKDKRIVEGDEIRTRFETRGGVNASKSFKKTAGC